MSKFEIFLSQFQFLNGFIFNQILSIISVLEKLPRMKRDSDVFDDQDDSEVASDIASPEMSPERIKESEALFNAYLNAEQDEGS